MFSMLRVTVVALVALIALFAAGCGTLKAAAKAEPGQAPSTSKADLDPLGAANTSLKGDAVDSGPSGYNVKDLKVPGAQYGLKSEAEKAEKAPGKKGKKGKGQGNPTKMAIPFSDAIADQMEGLPWGMTDKSVIAFFEHQVRAAYADQLKQAGGLVEEDRIRGDMLRDIAKLKKSYVEFKGQRTGFEGSLIENEFSHNNNESMLMWDGGKYVEYMFFFDGRFWKRLRAFRKDQINNLDFDAYVGTLTNRFGQGKEIMSADGQFVTFKWKDKNTYMNAEDRSGFYGVYCLVFSARVAEDNLQKLRPNQGRTEGRPKENVSTMVESVTGGDASDHNDSVIDSYTGSATPAPAGSPVKGSGSAPADKKGKGKKAQESKPEESKDKAESAPNIDDIF
ncbi:MAG: hypothetical protein MUC50_24110 [Myxococcota bacterium]|jgi:hypothetical protein|nr:hypothetical protein [Myxococcota bacterium]